MATSGESGIRGTSARDKPSAVWRVSIADNRLNEHTGQIGLSLSSAPTVRDATSTNALTGTTASGTVETYTVTNGPALALGEPDDITWTAGTRSGAGGASAGERPASRPTSIRWREPCPGTSSSRRTYAG